MTTAPVAVPGSHPRAGKWEPVPGTAGNHGNRLFEPISAFMARAESAPPVEWLLDDLLPSAGKVMLVAAPNAGKTWLALIAVKTAAAAGRECFLVEEEGGMRALADRMRALGLPAFPSVQVAHLRGVSLDDRETLQGLRAVLSGAVAPVLVLDPLNSVWSGDENETHAATLLRRKLDELCAANPRALVMLLHHTSKAGERGEGAAMYASRGSSVFSGWADCQLNLSHVSSPRGAGQVAFEVVVAKMRDGERGNRVRFKIDLGTGAVTRDEQRDRTTEDLESKVIAALRGASAGLSKSGAAKVVHARKEAVGRCIDDLLARGIVSIDPRGLVKISETDDAQAWQRTARECAESCETPGDLRGPPSPVQRGGHHGRR